jgi:hypothetical protein
VAGGVGVAVTGGGVGTVVGGGAVADVSVGGGVGSGVGTVVDGGGVGAGVDAGAGGGAVPSHDLSPSTSSAYLGELRMAPCDAETLKDWTASGHFPRLRKAAPR